MIAEKILAQTETLCPVCLERLKGRIIDKDDTVLLLRHCPSHGAFSQIISRHPEYYKQLRDYYFSTMRHGFRQTRYLLFITGRCNLNCPICFYGYSEAQELSFKEIKEIVLNNRGAEMVLFGKEPTCKDDLKDIIKFLKRHQHSVSLYSNGIKITDINYLRQLKKNGLDKIYLQFDGFKQNIYSEFRDYDLLKIKNKVLDNLKYEKLATVLNVTIAKGKNEDQIRPIFDYAVKNDFIRTVNLTCYIRSGKGRDFLPDNSIMPDDLIDIIEQQTNGRIRRDKVLLFQKLLYAYMSFLKRRTCLYIQYYWIYRDNDGYKPIDELIGLQRIEKVLDRYKNLMAKNGILARVYLLLLLPWRIINYNSIWLLADFIKVVSSHFFKIGEYSGKSSRFVQLIFSTACDPCKADFEIAQRCHIGIIYKDRRGEIKRNDENGLYLLDSEYKNTKK